MTLQSLRPSRNINNSRGRFGLPAPLWPPQASSGGHRNSRLGDCPLPPSSSSVSSPPGQVPEVICKPQSWSRRRDSGARDHEQNPFLAPFIFLSFHEDSKTAASGSLFARKEKRVERLHAFPAMFYKHCEAGSSFLEDKAIELLRALVSKTSLGRILTTAGSVFSQRLICFLEFQSCCSSKLLDFRKNKTNSSLLIAGAQTDPLPFIAGGGGPWSDAAGRNPCKVPSSTRPAGRRRSSIQTHPQPSNN